MRHAWFVGVLAGCSVPGAAAAPADDPVARLAPAWHVRNGDGLVVVDDTSLVTIGKDESGAGAVRLVELKDGYASVAIPIDVGDPAHAVLAGARIFIVDQAVPSVTAIARPNIEDVTSTRQWSQPMLGAIAGLATDGTRPYVVQTSQGKQHPTQDLIALAATTGKLAWSQVLPDALSITVIDASGGHGVVAGNLATGETSVAIALGFDLATGKILWRYHGPAGTGFAADPRHLVIARADALAVIDRVTGHALDAELPDSFLPEVQLAGDTAFLAGRVPGDAASGGLVVAVTLANRRSRTLYRGPIMNQTSIAVTARAVYVETPGGTIVALDRTTGARRWDWSAGVRVQLARAVGPGEQVFSIEPARIVAFAPAKVAPPLEVAEIRGWLRVECGEDLPREIRVGDQVITTDAKGRFATKVSARGSVGISPVSDGMPETSVELTGRGRYLTSTHLNLCEGD